MIDEPLDTSCHVVAGIAGQLLVGEQDDARAHHMITARKARYRIAQPTDRAVGADREIAVAGRMEARGTCLEFQSERLLRGRLNSLGVRPFRSRNGREPES